MMTRHLLRLPHLSIAAITLAAGVLAAACGGGGDPTARSVSSTTTSAPPSPTTTITASPTTASPTTAPPAMAPPATAPPTAAAPPTTARPPDVAVAIKSFAYDPSPLTVLAGTTVVWTNMDQIEHTVTSGAVGDGSKLPAVPAEPDGRFEGSMPRAGTSFSHRFDQPGTYRYYCARHDTAMSGTVVVN